MNRQEVTLTKNDRLQTIILSCLVQLELLNRQVEDLNKRDDPTGVANKLAGIVSAQNVLFKKTKKKIKLFLLKEVRDAIQKEMMRDKSSVELGARLFKQIERQFEDK